MATRRATANDSMAGKTCLVTGATSGIGAVTALELARRGASVILAGRQRERCEAASASIRAAVRGAAVEFLCADLSSQAEVRRLAAEFRERHGRLDVLIHNAGALFELRRASVDGIEMTLALNHLAPFLLTSLLRDVLEASGPARVIVVSSGAHEDVEAFDVETIDVEDALATPPSRRRGAYTDSRSRSLMYTLLMPKAHPAFRQYAQTKLANLLFTYEMSRRLAGTGVTVNAMHPGMVRTRFANGPGPFSWFMRQYLRLLGMSAEAGARTLVYLATSAEVAGVTGRYFFKEKQVPSSAASQDIEAARRLWELSERLTGGSAA